MRKPTALGTRNSNPTESERRKTPSLMLVNSNSWGSSSVQILGATGVSCRGLRSKTPQSISTTPFLDPMSIPWACKVLPTVMMLKMSTRRCFRTSELMLQTVLGRPCTIVSLVVAQREKGESFPDLAGDDETACTTDMSLSEVIGAEEEM